MRLKISRPASRLVSAWRADAGLITVGVELQGYRLSLSHIAEGEWRATFMAHRMFAPAGFGVAPTPWGVVQRAAWVAVIKADAR